MERARVLAACVSIGLVAATLSPLARDPASPRSDGFPLSTYPMFASKRKTKLTISYALGEGRAGERVVLSPAMIGTGEVLQAMRVIDNAVGAGRIEMASLCAAIAARVADEDDFANVTTVRIVTGTHDAVDYLVRHQVGREHERMRCQVAR